MPIYEYACADCKERFEVLVRTSTSEPKKCPKCEGANITRLFSTFGFSSGGNFVSSVEGPSCDSCTTDSCSLCR